MGYADHRAVGDGRVFEQGSLHLHRVHVLPTADDHVLGPVHDVDEALVIDPGDVAGVQPAFGECGGGGFLFVPVAAHDVGPLDPQLARDVGPAREVLGGLVPLEALGPEAYVT